MNLTKYNQLLLSLSLLKRVREETLIGAEDGSMFSPLDQAVRTLTKAVLVSTELAAAEAMASK